MTRSLQALAAQKTTTGATAALAPEPVPTPKAGSAPEDGDKKTEEIDDAVLQMAMAMAEGEAAPVEPEKDEGWFKNTIRKFDFNLAIQFFFSAIVVYSFGSSFIAIAFGRIQDRTGGDFTLYDFFDNIFAFKEWSLEYTLGFDPFKVWADFTGKKA